MRWLVTLAASVAFAGGACACGRVLEGLEETPIADAASDGAASGGDGLAPGPDALPSTPDGGGCRSPLVEGFEGDSWPPSTSGWVSEERDADFALVGPARSGDRALRVRLATEAGYVRFSRTIEQACAVRIELWIMRESVVPNTQLTVFELAAEERRRRLTIEGTTLILETEGGPTEVTSGFVANAWHHIELRYDPSGETQLRVDGALVNVEATVGTPRPSERISFGILGWIGADRSGIVLRFDDLRIE